MVTVFHYTPVNTKQFEGLNIDSLAGKRQKCQKFPPSKFCAIRYPIIKSLCHEHALKYAEDVGEFSHM